MRKFERSGGECWVGRSLRTWVTHTMDSAWRSKDLVLVTYSNA